RGHPPLSSPFGSGCPRPGRGRSVEELALSFVHMNANRLLRAAARAQELVLYDLLVRHYHSIVARTGFRADNP
ncbi:MAG: hypothetical protein PVF40_07500, partial [Ectothiorhodospiraceae bacterium]